MAFLGGISGQIYRQFALTIAVLGAALGLQRAVAQPGASAHDSAAPAAEAAGCSARFFDRFNQAFDLDDESLLRRRARPDPPLGCWRWLRLRSSIWRPAWLFKILPAGFLPDEDQGVFFAARSLAGWRVTRSHERAASKIEKILATTPGVGQSPLSAAWISSLDEQFQRRHDNRDVEAVGRAEIERNAV